jgi:hypothetical protein
VDAAAPVGAAVAVALVVALVPEPAVVAASPPTKK